MPAPPRVRTVDELYGYGSAFAEYEAFTAALDRSLTPRGSDLLLDLVAGLGLPPGSVAVDVGAREARHCIELSRRRSASMPPASTRSGSRPRSQLAG